ncbi:UBP-type zinc finger domain-containing protein [Gordonia soli]|uniref:UBP-type domain-containing protein n=1 Tax=Gordonia soli NBRC 108243 TaxID=1223545 RepID=M0QFG3_9ACTN|nr:UBP-type zinc finger domain-containing protein [Gordonia soli]GAC67308.1 hypothetical protein GS4_07_00570 [Gordonia soli NBRC 108243]
MADRPINTSVGPSGPGCADCEATGSWWFHLRRCVDCGHVGCCDDSLHRHARGHVNATGHTIIQSFEPGEDWFYDFTDDSVFEGPTLAEPTSHPVDQTVPGPRERVPADWVQQLEAR